MPTDDEIQKKIKELTEKIQKVINDSPIDGVQIEFGQKDIGGTPGMGMKVKKTPSPGVTAKAALGDAGGNWDVQCRPDHDRLHFQGRPKGQSTSYGHPYNVAHVNASPETLELVTNLISAGAGDKEKVAKSMAGSETVYLIVQRASLTNTVVNIGDPPLQQVTLPGDFFTTAGQLPKPPEMEPEDDDDDDDGDDEDEFSIS